MFFTYSKLYTKKSQFDIQKVSGCLNARKDLLDVKIVDDEITKGGAGDSTLSRGSSYSYFFSRTHTLLLVFMNSLTIVSSRYLLSPKQKHDFPRVMLRS